MSAVVTKAMTGVEDIEIDLLLEGLYRAHGFDFREYSRASIKRRILELMRAEKLETVSAFQDRVLHDRGVSRSFPVGAFGACHRDVSRSEFLPDVSQTSRAAAQNLSDGADLGGRLFDRRRSLFAGDPASGGACSIRNVASMRPTSARQSCARRAKEFFRSPRCESTRPTTIRPAARMSFPITTRRSMTM